ncbi:MAG: hypothetical protein R3C59_28405 [Planctomycetaceae bacterium]
MRELPGVVLTEAQEEEAERIRDILSAKSQAVVDYVSRLLASRDDGHPLGETEFLIRDAVHRLGAEGIDAALHERKLLEAVCVATHTRGTQVRAASAPNAGKTPDSRDTVRVKSRR